MIPIGRLLTILAAPALCLLLGCTRANVTSDTGGGTGSEVVGVVYTPGLSGAANAQVQIVASDKDPRFASGYDTTVTADQAGVFKIGGLNAGSYNFISRKDSLFAYTKNIAFHYDGSGDVVPDTIRDTLRRAGSLSGIVQLQPEDDPRTVIVLLIGTGSLVGCDTAGRFVIGPLAAGTYSVRLLSTYDSYGVLDTELTIVSGVSATLPSPIILPFHGVPVVHGLSINYDSIMEIVNLSWTSGGASATGYHVFRRDTTEPLPGKELTTAQIQTLAFTDPNLLNGHTYRYHVTAVGPNGLQGGPFFESVPITVTSPYKVKVLLDDASLLSVYGGIAAIGDTLFALNTDAKVVLLFDTSGNPIRQFGDTGGSVLINPAYLTSYRDKIWVLDRGSSWPTIKRYTSHGVFEIEFECHTMGGPDHLCIWDDNTICVTDAQFHKVIVVDSTGAEKASSTYPMQMLGHICRVGPDLAVDDHMRGAMAFMDTAGAFQTSVQVLDSAQVAGGSVILAMTSPETDTSRIYAGCFRVTDAFDPAKRTATGMVLVLTKRIVTARFSMPGQSQDVVVCPMDFAVGNNNTLYAKANRALYAITKP